MTVDRHKASFAVIELLAETYPHCFQTYEGRRKPLKVGRPVLERMRDVLPAPASQKVVALPGSAA
jgi:sRNA-binding protein